jgi:hypothetical protein
MRFLYIDSRIYFPRHKLGFIATNGNFTTIQTS